LSMRLRNSGARNPQGAHRKVMDVGYFAELKGLVGCCYKPSLAFKVRETGSDLKIEKFVRVHS